MIDNLKIDLKNKLKYLGITSGRTIFVQSDLFSFMGVARIVTPKKLPELVLDCLIEAVGSSGTIVMPSFTTDCARKGLAFDLHQTPSDSGALVEYMRKRPGTFRSLHPVNSVIASGNLAESLTKDVSPGSYSWDSPFDRMVSCDTIVLCMGMKANLSNSFSHLAETKANLPYLYNKMLDYVKVSVNGVTVSRQFYMTVRYINFDIKPDRKRHDQVMKESGLMRFYDWGGGNLHAINLSDYLDILKHCLSDDIFFLLAHPPVFRKNHPPYDGIVIKNAGQTDERV